MLLCWYQNSRILWDKKNIYENLLIEEEEKNTIQILPNTQFFCSCPERLDMCTCLFVAVAPLWTSYLYKNIIQSNWSYHFFIWSDLFRLLLPTLFPTLLCCFPLPLSVCQNTLKKEWMKARCKNQIFTNLAPLGRVGHRVAMSVCVSVCLCVCAIKCSFFLGLSLAPRSHDQIPASHWSTPPKPPNKKNK